MLKIERIEPVLEFEVVVEEDNMLKTYRVKSLSYETSGEYVTFYQKIIATDIIKSPFDIKHREAVGKYIKKIIEVHERDIPKDVAKEMYSICDQIQNVETIENRKMPFLTLRNVKSIKIVNLEQDKYNLLTEVSEIPLERKENPPINVNIPQIHDIVNNLNISGNTHQPQFNTVKVLSKKIATGAHQIKNENLELNGNETHISNINNEENIDGEIHIDETLFENQNEKETIDLDDIEQLLSNDAFPKNNQEAEELNDLLFEEHNNIVDSEKKPESKVVQSITQEVDDWETLMSEQDMDHTLVDDDIDAILNMSVEDDNVVSNEIEFNNINNLEQNNIMDFYQDYPDKDIESAHKFQSNIDEILEKIEQNSYSNNNSEYQSSVEQKKNKDQRYKLIKESLNDYLYMTSVPFNPSAFYHNFLVERLSSNMKLSEEEMIIQICNMIKDKEININKFVNPKAQEIIHKNKDTIQFFNDGNLKNLLGLIKQRGEETRILSMVDLIVYMRKNNFI